MGKMSRNKGASGERELAKKLSSMLGVSARRGRQYSGSPDSPDVVAIDGIHIECKRTERLNAYSALDQATSDAGENIPVVFHRKNRREWIVIVRLDDLPLLCNRIVAHD